MQRSTRKATLSPATAFQLWMAVVTMTALHVLHWRHSTHWLLLHARQSTAVLGPPAAQNAETPIRLVGGGGMSLGSAAAGREELRHGDADLVGDELDLAGEDG
jgi:hypothetical protein